VPSPRNREVNFGQILSTLVLAQARWLFLQKTIAFFRDIAPITQRLLPLSLQAASDETILRLNRLVLPFGAFRLIGGPLQALLPMAVQALTLLMHVLDRFQAQLQSGGLEGAQNLLGHEIVHHPGFEPATRRSLVLPPHTPIIGGRLAPIAGVHPPATGPAAEQARQQRLAGAGHPGRTGPRAVLEQPLPVGLILFPCDIGWQAVPFEHQPLRHRYLAHLQLAAPGGRALVIDAAPAVGIGPRIDRVMEHPAHRAWARQAPFQLAAPWSAVEAHPQTDPIPDQIAVEALARAQLVELVEDHPHGRLDLLVGIEGDFPGGQLDIPAGDVEEQRAPIGLVQPAAFQSIVHQN
jgi:hypothetical protein